MSHNRRMFGGRPGGGPGGHIPSPWEGGVVPGQGRPASAGILGAAPQSLNLLSQLSTPEAQLALASNLLTSLLGQQQQQQQAPPMQQPRVPPGPQPLLSMNATAPGRVFFPRPDGMKHGGGPMRQGRSHGSRFPDSYKRGEGRSRGQPMKRGGMSGGPQRNQKRLSSGTPSKSSPSVEKKSTESSAEKANAEEATNNEEHDSSKDDSVSKVKEEREDEEDEEVEGGKKRDWKDEKNVKKDLMDVDEDNPDKKEESESKKDKASESPKKEKGSESKKEKVSRGSGATDASRYETIPKELLVCHICNKHMWDGQSFENHLRGKSHQMMMDQTEKSYKVQVNLMRQDLKLAEEKREIEMERVQRLGKKIRSAAEWWIVLNDNAKEDVLT